jgi:hypothetical protein
MKFINYIIENKLLEAKNDLYNRLTEIAQSKLDDIKTKLAEERSETINEAVAVRRNPNIIRMGRIQKIRRRIRRNAKNKIIVQKNVRRSSIKGYKISGNTLRRIPAVARIRKARLLRKSWQTSRRGKLRRTLMKRKMSMRRRTSLGLR